LMDGKPAAGVKVELSQQDELYRNAAGRQTLETDNAGKLAFIPAQAGRYLIEASYQSAEKTELADQIRATLTLTFEVGLP
ncbi:MAG: cobalt ABC transporter substrate-binding protein, partial [Alishewanella sp. 32-51-5]